MLPIQILVITFVFFSKNILGIVREKLIPPIVFRAFTSNDDLSSLHPLFKQSFNETITSNPGYVIVFFNNDDIEDLIQQIFPSLIEFYYALMPGTYKADLFRLLILYHFGGIYNDMGNKYVRKISEIVLEEDEFVGLVDCDPKDLQITFLAAYPQHPIIHEMIQLVLENIHYRRYNCNNLDITGPRTAGRAFSRFFCSRQSQVKIPGKYEIEGYKIHLLQFHAANGRQTMTEGGKL